MSSFVSELLPRLSAHRLDHFDAGPGALYPYYERLSLANLPASICHWLGAPGLGLPPLEDQILQAMGGPFRHVILLVVDGLGLQQLQGLAQPARGRPASRAAFWRNLLDEAVLTPITSISPSTTASAITTLWTGQPAGVHGVMGYEMYLKEYALIANMITHAPVSFVGDTGGLRRAGFNPETFLPVPTLGPHLVRQGIQPYAVQHFAIAHSGLSSMLFPEVNVVPFRSPSDLWITLPGLLQSHNDEPSYTYIYYSEIDELSHRFGPADPRVDLEFSLFSFLLEGFFQAARKSARGDTLFLITADHGHLSTPRSPDLEARNHPEFDPCLTLIPSGENRLAYLYPRPGREARLQEVIHSNWPGKFTLTPSEAVIASGLFGPGQAHPRLAERVGDFVLFAHDNAYLWWSERENPLLGRHGGLSPVEMVVPLLGLVL